MATLKRHPTGLCKYDLDGSRNADPYACLCSIIGKILQMTLNEKQTRRNPSKGKYLNCLNPRCLIK